MFNTLAMLKRIENRKGESDMSETYLGIDIGGTAIKSARLTADGEILEKETTPTPQEISPFLETIDTLIQAAKGAIAGVVVSCPGMVDTTNGVIYFGGALPFLHELALADYIQTQFQLPATVINDAKAAASAELWRGNLQGVSHGLALILGTAVGGGVISNGKLLEGAHFQAGEMSWMLPVQETLDLNQNLGIRGSAVQLVKRVAEAIGLEDTSDGRAVFEAINQKDAIAYPLFEAYCRELAYAIFNVQTVIDMERVVIGGGISVQAIVVEEIQRQYEQLIAQLGPMKMMVTPVDIHPCAFGSDANLIGALYQFHQDKGK